MPKTTALIMNLLGAIQLRMSVDKNEKVPHTEERTLTEKNTGGGSGGGQLQGLPENVL